MSSHHPPSMGPTAPTPGPVTPCQYLTPRSKAAPSSRGGIGSERARTAPFALPDRAIEFTSAPTDPAGGVSDLPDQVRVVEVTADPSPHEGGDPPRRLDPG